MVMPGVTIRKVSVKRCVLGVGQFVQGLPGDKHGHDHGLAAAGGHFEGDAVKDRVGGLVGLAEFIVNPGVAVFFGHFGDIDGRFQGFNLAEKEAFFPVRPLPVFQQAGGRLGDAAIAALTPEMHPGAHVD